MPDRSEGARSVPTSPMSSSWERVTGLLPCGVPLTVELLNTGVPLWWLQETTWRMVADVNPFPRFHLFGRRGTR